MKSLRDDWRYVKASKSQTLVRIDQNVVLVNHVSFVSLRWYLSQACLVDQIFMSQ